MRSHQFTRLALACAATLAVSGCASFAANFGKKKDEPAPAVEQAAVKETDKPLRTSRELTLSYDNLGRAGAAMHHPDYVHVLGDRHDWAEINGPYGSLDSGDGRNKGRTRTLSYSGSKNSRPGTGFSVYELQRWERYCNGGKGMDERDWRFVASEQYNPPLDALGSCRAPSFDYSNYLEAWTRFCNGSSQYSSQDKAIVSNSSRPFTTVNPCRALSSRNMM